MKLLLATHNPGKISELEKGFKCLEKQGINLITLSDLGIQDDPEETGTTLEENAELKARFYADKTGLPTVADDGGFIIPHLNNEPGVKSKRWLGRDATDNELIEYTLKRMEGVTGKERKASLRGALCYYNPQTGKIIILTADIHGHIADKPTDVRIEGFPYRALLVIDGYGKYYDELSPAEHNETNHRLRNIKEIIPSVVADILYEPKNKDSK